MKILFGINNDETVKGIASFYEEKYNDKIEYKNVYYLKQFIQELSSGEYDRAVLLEELERFPTSNYAQIDAYLFTNLDNITDVFDGKNLIYIASERRRLGDEFLSKLFNLGIYSVLTGQNRTKGKVSELIYSPYTKKNVKKYYEDKVGENVYRRVQVSEIELQRIVSYYKNLNGVADKYNEVFDRVASQYTDEQLKIIIKFLPADVKQYLSFNNEKYKQIVAMADTQTVIYNEEGQPTQMPLEDGEVSQRNINININATADIPQQQDAVKAAEGSIAANLLNNKPDMGERLVGSQDSSPEVEIIKEPEIIEKIVVKEKEAPVVTEVVEKQVYQSIYEVPKDYRKVVCFVGAPKCGTTFCVNAIATTLARGKVKTGLLDMTRKRDSYIIYTYDDEGKRAIAAESTKYASKGMNEPLVYEKFSVYTAVPGEERKNYNAGRVIETIMDKNNIVIIDADFSTPLDYFRLCQDIYIVQDMDIININQLTIFLKELKFHGIPMSKVKLIINKHMNCTLTAKEILDGISTYASYDLKKYDQIFNEKLDYFIIPFHEENYRKYVEMLYNYSNLFATFTDDFKDSMNRIINTIYPAGNLLKTATKAQKKMANSKKKGIFKGSRIEEEYFSAAEDDEFEREVR